MFIGKIVVKNPVIMKTVNTFEDLRSIYLCFHKLLPTLHFKRLNTSRYHIEYSILFEIFSERLLLAIFIHGS